jgi:hypothetical protein
MDHRDRLILALSALLGAEREARQALEDAIASQALGPDLLQALIGDPGRGLSQDDIVLAEEFSQPYRRSPSGLPS